MRLVHRSAHSLMEQRRDQARRRRAAAPRFDEACPSAERVRVELVFREPGGPDPSRQLHDLYPSAEAILDFVCPHGDCDGRFDLTDYCLDLLRASSPTGQGIVACEGHRPAAAANRRRCTLSLKYRVFATYGQQRG